MTFFCFALDREISFTHDLKAYSVEGLYTERYFDLESVLCVFRRNLIVNYRQKKRGIMTNLKP